MVLASNEWLNNCEDDQRSTTGNTPTATTTAAPATTATATTPASGNQEIAPTAVSPPTPAPVDTTTTATTLQQVTNSSSSSSTNITNTIIVAIPNTSFVTATTTATGATTARTTNAKNEIMSENPNSELQHPQQQPQQVAQQQQKSILCNDVLVAAAIAESNGPLIQEVVNNNSEVLSCDTSNTTNTNSNNSNDSLIRSVNSDIGVSNANATNASEILNTSDQTTNNANEEYSNPNSNTSTLQSAIVRQSTVTATQPGAGLLPLSSPITPQALSSALQSVMNASNNTTNNINVTTTTVGNLQNSFLSSLGANSNSITLQQQQQNTKEFNTTTYCGGSGGTGGGVGVVSGGGLTEVQTNLINSTNNTITTIQNMGSSSNLSMNLNEVVDTANNGQAKIVLLCEANSHPFQTRTIQLTPNIECKVGRLIAKSKASESNAIFDCKVLSRNHAVLWYTDDGKFWVKDTKSSNGTFINENKLGTEAAELHFGDIVKFGVDVLENSRKEVHGCIIAFVKLYLPDGREAISIDTSTQQRSQYSGEGRISYEEMHRLNLYMQEVSQREKALKSKLFNIQNVLDATRKNSALCWQSLIAEDQLLHRINSLEKKLQIMEKNVPDSVLRNEVLKLLEDKNSYQLTAKEALRKVYQERCDALQMLSKMELAYANSDGECKILRDQIMSTKQSLQDVNSRLQRLETDYNEYKEEAERKQQEIKEQEEQRIAEMAEKLQQRELECDDLKRRVSEFMLQRAAELVDEEEKKLQLQAIEKLDAVIGDMDLGGDEDDDDEDEDGDDYDDNADGDDAGGCKNKDNAHDNKAKGDEGDGAEHKEDGNEKEFGKKSLRLPRVVKSLDVLNGGGSRKSLHSSDEIEILNTSPGSGAATKKRIKKKGGSGDPKESTILKWLQNSDLNKKEGSIDIFKAICNESDSSDEQDLPINEDSNAGGGMDSESGIDTNTTSAEEIKLKYKKSKNKLQSVQSILCQLVDAELSKECYSKSKSKGANANVHHNVSEEDNEALLELKRSENNDMSDDHKLLLLQRSVAMVNEAYKEICDSLNAYEANKALVLASSSSDGDTKEPTPPPTQPVISVHTQLQNYGTSFNKSSGSAKSKKLLMAQDTLKPLLTEDAGEDERLRRQTSAAAMATDLKNNDEANIEETTAATSSTVVSPSNSNIKSKLAEEEESRLKAEISEYKEQIKDLNLKLEQVESDAHNTLEIMQIECDTFREKVEQLTKVVQKAFEEKEELKRILDERVTSAELQEKQQQVVLTQSPLAESGQSHKIGAETQVSPSSTIDVPEEAAAAESIASTAATAQTINNEAGEDESEMPKRRDNTTEPPPPQLPPLQSLQSSTTTTISASTHSTTSSSGIVMDAEIEEDFETQLNDDMAAISSTALQREEELIVYKERLEKTQNDNLQLRNEIAELLLQSGSQAQMHMVKQMLAYGTVAAAIIIYCIITYY